jgi:Flp pilus assembly protein TadD
MPQKFFGFRQLSAVGASLAVAASLMLSACSTTQKPAMIGTHGGVTVTGSVDKLSDAQLGAAATAWGQRYDANPKDRDTALNYAAVLRLNNRSDQAVAVLERAFLANPNDRELSAAYGKTLASAGRFDQALRVIRQTQDPARPDWKLFSAEGAILDQMGDSAGAREVYAKALQIAPGEPSVLNNMALSNLLGGDIVAAEKLLRQANAAPNATSRVRQNLALVLGLQGKFQEADAIARQELDPQQADANVAYLRSMLTQTNTWKQARKQG